MKPAGLKPFGWTFAMACYGRPFGRRRWHEVYVDRVVKGGWRSRENRRAVSEGERDAAGALQRAIEGVP